MAGRGEGGLSVLWSTSLLLVVKLHLVSIIISRGLCLDDSWLARYML